MLTSSLKQFQKNIDDLRNFINAGVIQEQKYADYLGEDCPSKVSNSKNLDSFLANYEDTNNFNFRKIVNYNAIVVMLYGYLERYVESVAKEYLEGLVRLTDSYNELPEKIKENHFSKSIELSQNIKRYDKYSNITEKIIIKRLYSFYLEEPKYQLNIEAYTHHTANFKSDTINQFFQNLGIENVNNDVMQNKSISQSNLKLSRLDDLAVRRNEIAHGVETSEILEIKYFKEYYLEFVESYIIALNCVLSDKLIPYELKNGVVLKEKIKIIDNSILCLDIENMDIDSIIKTRDRVLSKTINKDQYRQGRIISIQENNETIQEVKVDGKSKKIGIKVDFKIKDNQEFYLIQT
jgi:hypothetical protein